MNNIINFFSSLTVNHLVLAFIIFYSLGLIFSRFIPAFFSFLLIGFLLKYIFPQNIFNYLYSYFLPVYIYSLIFYLGLNLPWQNINLIRKRLYRYLFSSVFTISVILIAIYFLLKNYLNFLPSIIKDNFSIFPYLFIFFSFPAFQEIKNFITDKKLNGILTSTSRSLALLLNIIGITLLIFLFIEPSLLPKILFESFLAIVFIYFTKYFTRINFLQNILSLAFLLILIKNELGYSLLPLITGLTLNMLWKGKKEILPAEIINFLNYLMLIIITPILFCSKEILILSLILFALKQLLFHIVFYLWGKVFFSESVYKNIAGILAFQGILPAVFLLTFNFLNLSSVNFSLIFSITFFISLFDFIFWKYKSFRAFKKSGELNNYV